MRHGWRCRFAIALVSLMACLLSASNAQAAIQWVDWQAQTTPASATGVLGSRTITVTGPLSPATFIGGAGEQNFWAAFPLTYAAPAAGVPNAPATSDMIRISGNAFGAATYTITFSQPVTNPVMAIASLGGPPTPTRVDFGSQPFVLLHQGPGFWGAGSLTQIGNVLEGREGNGVIRLSGTMTQILFTMPTPEVWTGFTVGIENAMAPPPTGASVRGALAWEYLPEDLPNIVNGGFRIYRAVGPSCDALTPLMDLIGSTPPTQLEYADLTIPVPSGRVCYEVDAFNEVGPSPHSNRAEVLVETLIPAQPGAITVQVIVE
jgi:hypothetical protein